MSVRVDEDLPNHPKVLHLRHPESAWFFVCGLCYCQKHATDGVIPACAVRRISTVRRPLACAEDLVSVGLWERDGDGFRVHDYHDWQPTAAQVKDRRRKSADRVKRWRERERNGVTNVPIYGVTNALPAQLNPPLPSPSVDQDHSAAALSQDSKPRARDDAPERAAAVFDRSLRKAGRR